LFTNKELTVSKAVKFFEHAGYLFSIVKTNKKVENYEGRVIDIEVDNEDHHNFHTHTGLVKNGGGKRNVSFAASVPTRNIWIFGRPCSVGFPMIGLPAVDAPFTANTR